jgi:hypothetical protein
VSDLGLLPSPGSAGRRVVVGFSGGVTSAWCAGWALRTFPRDEVILMFHDTKEEHDDTYRFIREMQVRLAHPIVEVSDGRSVTELFRDIGFLGNNQQTPCSRILKREPGDRYVAGLIAQGFSVVQVFGFSPKEPERIARAVGRCFNAGTACRFPLIEELVTKQQCSDWCNCDMGVRPSVQYEHFEHANCKGCVKGARDYWLKTYEVDRPTFDQRADMEEEFGHSIIRGENPILLRDLVKIGLKRKVNRKERIEIGACDCGD